TVCAQAIKCSLMPACPICACYVPNCGKRRAGQKPQSPVAVRKPSSLKRERAFARKGKHPVVGIQGLSSEDFIERIVHDAIREFPFRGSFRIFLRLVQCKTSPFPAEQPL
ncbi:MAG: hypothetical protein PUD50_09010, partial [Eubacteriales bacterium]|nr:hypothetical protein [Eubacteriales bacterium]